MTAPEDVAVEPAEVAAAPAPVVSTGSHMERRLRISGLLIIAGMLVEGGTLFALDRPVGFLTFAGVGGILILVGVLYYLWSLV
jgi:hypothetical protein